MNCPCGNSQQSYETCCKKFHEGTPPSTAIELMRSRYSAYALKNADYIMDTTHPKSPYFEKKRTRWKHAILMFCNQNTFNQLEILDYGENWVHFKAYVSDFVLNEKSTFEKINQRWFYLKGELSQKATNPG